MLDRIQQHILPKMPEYIPDGAPQRMQDSMPDCVACSPDVRIVLAQAQVSL